MGGVVVTHAKESWDCQNGTQDAQTLRAPGVQVTDDSPDWLLIYDALCNRGVGNIVARAAADHHATVEEVCGRCTYAHVVEARVAVWRELHGLGWSAAFIGRLFDRDHSTILHGLRKPRPQDA